VLTSAIGFSVMFHWRFPGPASAAGIRARPPSACPRRASPRLAILALAAVLALPAAALAAGGAAPALPSRGFEDILICGALLMMGLYHLVIFGLRRNNLASLSLAAYCLLRAFYAVCSAQNGLGLLRFLPRADPAVAFSVGMTSVMASLPFLQAFFRALFPRQFPGWGLRGLSLVVLVCVAAGLSLGFSGPVLHAQLLCMLAVVVYTVANLGRAWRAGESGAAILLAGYGVLALCSVNDVLLGEGLIAGIWLAPIGTLALVLAQSGLLAQRFSRAFATTARLSARLEKQNDRLEAEIAHRSQLQRQLDTIGEEERRFVSRALHDGLCQDLTAARLHCSLWQSGSGDQSAAFGKVSELLESAVDQAYELSRGLWPMGPEIADLPGALRELGETLAAEHGLAVSVRCEVAGVDLSEAQNERLFQIAKEALQNVAKHAHARRADLDLRPVAGTGLRLTVEDDGIGLPVDNGIGQPAGAPARGGLGTRIMAHHAQAIGGTLTLSSRPEGGTRVELVVPLPYRVAAAGTDTRPAPATA
jgi:signal transduction histidine kinase